MEQADQAALSLAQSQAEKDKRALDELCAILSTGDQPWPSGADFLEWCAEIVTRTGREIK